MASRTTRTLRSHPHSSERARRAFRIQRMDLLDHLEPRMLLSVDPVGSVDIFTATSISGWARDADIGNQPITVRLTIDGTSTDTVANNVRPDLVPVFGAGGFGFALTPTLSPGSHTVSLSAVDPQTNVPTVLKSGVLVNNAPIGSADIVTSTRVAGWAFDKDTAGGTGSAPINVRIDNNGVVGTPFAANVTRGDLSSLGSTNHGFDVSGSFGVVDIWGIDSPTGTPVLLKSTNHVSVGNVEVLTRSTVSGWVWDPDRGAAAVTVRVKVDGVDTVDTVANLERPDVAGVTGGSTAHGFIANLTLSPGSHKIEVFAEETDTTSVAETLLGTSGSVSNPPPIGSIDFATRGTVSGWAWDPDGGANPLTVQVKVDGTQVATATANQSRPDIVSVTGSAAHGYTVNLSGLATGPHKIEVDALDAPTGTSVMIAQKVIDNTLPIGSIDVADTSTIAGWAYDQDPGSGPLQVILEMDGSRYPVTTANVARPDLTVAAGFRENTHGFVIATPTNLSGVHTVRVIALDSFDGTEQVIGIKQFINHAPIGNIDFAGAIGIAGWAYDPDDPAKSIDVLVYVDGALFSQSTASNNRPDLVSLLGSAAHGYSVSIAGVSPGAHTLEVFGVDPDSHITTSLGQRSVVV